MTRGENGQRDRDPMTDLAADDPLERLARALHRAEETEPDVPNAMVLATVGSDGRPSARVVLLKEIGPAGLAFYTNYDSRKGHELAAAPHAALCIHWKTQGQQVRVEGHCDRMTAEESDAYFVSRPQASQLGALASAQSQPIASRQQLEDHYQALVEQYGDTPPPRPSHWGGFWLRPSRMEFWQHRASRMHDRELYERIADGWRRTLLQP